MNKWQIICPVSAMLIVGLLFGIIAVRGQHRGFISVATRSIGSDLVTSTNSPHLVRVGPDLRAQLSKLLGAPTHISTVLLGDELSPIGDGPACSRLLLTNDLGGDLMIRLRRAEKAGMFEVLGFSTTSE